MQMYQECWTLWGQAGKLFKRKKKSQQRVNNKAGVTSNYLYRTAYSPCHSDKLFLSNSEAAFGRAPSKEGSSHLLGTKVQQWTLTAPLGFRGCGTLQGCILPTLGGKQASKIKDLGLWRGIKKPVKEDTELMGLAWGTPRSFWQRRGAASPESAAQRKVQILRARWFHPKALQGESNRAASAEILSH